MVPLGQQLRIEAGIIGPRTRVGPHPDRPGGGPGTRILGTCVVGHPGGPYRGDVTSGTLTVLIAHGSRNPATALEHAALSERIGRAAGSPVVPAYLELSVPSIPDAIDAAVAGGASTVRLVPFFLHVGNHVLVDLPEIVERARGRHPDTTIVLEEHIGADPRVVDLVADRIRP